MKKFLMKRIFILLCILVLLIGCGNKAIKENEKPMKIAGIFINNEYSSDNSNV